MSLSIPKQRSPLGPVQMALALSLCVIVTGLMIWLRLVVFSDRVFPLSSGLPLLLCLWHRNKLVLYAMALVLSLVSIVKYGWLLPAGIYPTGYETTIVLSQFTNIWVVAFVIHGLIHTLQRVENKRARLAEMNAELETSNEELAASNEELAAREEEITRQNEELQSQTEELEQQAEELRQQAEEMEQQAAEIQEANHELTRKERGLQTLLESGRWLRGDLNEAMVLNGITQATVQVFADDIQAAVIARNLDGGYDFIGDFGFGLHGANAREIAFHDSFASLVLESRQTASITDILTRPDIKLPRAGVGAPFRAVLASPVWENGEPVAVLEVYCASPRQWTEHEYRVVEWMATQAALALQSIHSREELEQRHREAEAASIQKTRFLAAVSHDVRTPANAISLLAEFIGKCASDPAKFDQIPGLANHLWSNAKSMVELVSDVLDLTRFDSGRVELDVSTFSLNELMESEIRVSQPFAESKKLQLEASIPEEEIRLATDRTKLARVISNLVNNAIKFTEGGTVKLGCAKAEDGGLLVSVADTGIGIPSDHLGLVFDEFFQMRNPERNRDKGAGLGLAICQRLLKGLGFEVEVKSLVGVGTTFTVKIPADRIVLEAGNALPGNLSDQAVANPLRGLGILLIEDHDTARDITSRLLEEEGANVTTASTGREAVHFLGAGNYDLILLDLNLPDFDGTEILRHLHASPAYESPPQVLVLTGDVRRDRIEEVMELGADGLIPKPVSLDKIKEFLSRTPASGIPDSFDGA